MIFGFVRMHSMSKYDAFFEMKACDIELFRIKSFKDFCSDLFLA